MFESVGTLRYSPKILGVANERWWLVVDCDPEIGRYFRNLFFISRFCTEKIMRPAWKEHISVIRNEEPVDQFKPLWEKYANAEVVFRCDTQVNTNGLYYWIKVDCPRLSGIRLELGLTNMPENGFHLTIGNQI